LARNSLTLYSSACTNITGATDILVTVRGEEERKKKEEEEEEEEEKKKRRKMDSHDNSELKEVEVMEGSGSHDGCCHSFNARKHKVKRSTFMSTPPAQRIRIRIRIRILQPQPQRKHSRNRCSKGWEPELGKGIFPCTFWHTKYTKFYLYR